MLIPHHPFSQQWFNYINLFSVLSSRSGSAPLTYFTSNLSWFMTSQREPKGTVGLRSMIDRLESCVKLRDWFFDSTFKFVALPVLLRDLQGRTVPSGRHDCHVVLCCASPWLPRDKCAPQDAQWDRDRKWKIRMTMELFCGRLSRRSLRGGSFIIPSGD